MSMINSSLSLQNCKMDIIFNDWLSHLLVAVIQGKEVTHIDAMIRTGLTLSDWEFKGI